MHTIVMISERQGDMFKVLMLTKAHVRAMTLGTRKPEANATEEYYGMKSCFANEKKEGFYRTWEENENKIDG